MLFRDRVASVLNGIRPTMREVGELLEIPSLDVPDRDRPEDCPQNSQTIKMLHVARSTPHSADLDQRNTAHTALLKVA